MRTALIAVALLASGAAIAQTYPSTAEQTQPETTAPDQPVDSTTPADATEPIAAPPPASDMVTTPAPVLAAASGPVVAAGNTNPEHDARGIAVISDPAVVPAGFNGVTGTAMGGPLVDPATGEAIDAADDSYPNCTAEVTDNCLQAYERGRSPQ